MFDYRFIRYIFNHSTNVFVPLLFNVNRSYSELLTVDIKGIQNEEELRVAVQKYGKCEINVPIKPIPILLVTEILNPFYLF
jgi:hypothetical protein